VPRPARREIFRITSGTLPNSAAFLGYLITTRAFHSQRRSLFNFESRKDQRRTDNNRKNRQELCASLPSYSLQLFLLLGTTSTADDSRLEPALALQAAFADINIHKNRSVYYWLYCYLNLWGGFNDG